MALKVLNAVDEAEHARTTVKFGPETPTEERAHAIRLLACKMIRGHYNGDHGEARGLEHEGTILRDFLVCISSPVIQRR